MTALAPQRVIDSAREHILSSLDTELIMTQHIKARCLQMLYSLVLRDNKPMIVDTDITTFHAIMVCDVLEATFSDLNEPMDQRVSARINAMRRQAKGADTTSVSVSSH